MPTNSLELTKTLNFKLFELRKYVDVVKKSKSGYGYKYASIVEILAKLKAGMERKLLLLEPLYVPGTQKVTIDHYEKTKVKTDKAGNKTPETETVHEFIVQQEMIWRWTDLESGETKEIPWAAVGEQADPSQAQGGALTYAERQFLTQYFQIATPEDDPDNYRSQKAEAEEDAQYEAAQQIITKIDAVVHAYLDASGNSDESRKKLTAIIKKYVKKPDGKPSADYINDLTNPTIAEKLLAELEKQTDIRGR